MRRWISWLLAIIMTVTLFSTVYANDQDPVDRVYVADVSYVLGTDYITGESVINPTVTFGWDNPDTWNEDGDYHEPIRYDVGVRNVTFGEEEEDKTVLEYFSGDAPFTDSQVDLHNEIDLQTGSLYELSLQPYHEHYTYNEDGSINRTIEIYGDELSAFALTDVATEYISGSEEIQVIWEDVGVSSFQYRIAYALGEYDTLDDLLDNSEGVHVVTSSSAGVDSYVDPQTNRNMLTYTIDNNIIPGQSYSIMVETIASEYNGQPIARNRYYPNITSVATSVELFLEDEGAEQIRLSWDIPVSYEIDGNTSTLSELRILEYEYGSPSTVAIFNGTAGTIGYYLLDKPDTDRIYQLEVTYTNQTQPTTSNQVSYSPTDYYITPTTPSVPELLTEELLEALLPDPDLNEDNSDAVARLEADYFVDDYDYDGLASEVMEEDVTFHVEEEGGFNFAWSAFKRLDVDASSDTHGEDIYDNDVYYDIYVTDDFDALSYMEPTYPDIIHTAASDENAIVNEPLDEEDDTEIVGYRQTLDKYYRAATENTVGAETAILPGNLYYISIKAKKVTGRGTLTSGAYTVAVYYSYDGDAYAPPAIAKPPFRVKDSETTEDGITVQWKESWYEIMSDAATAGAAPELMDWQHQLWMNSAGDISETELTPVDDSDEIEYYRIYDKYYKNIDEIQRFIDDYVTDHPAFTEDTYRERVVDLAESSDEDTSDVAYRFLYMRYDDVVSTINERQLSSDYDDDYSFDDYIKDLIDADSDGTAPLSWSEITPEDDEDDEGYLAYRQEGLRENTSYVFMLLPNRTLEDGQELSAHYPATLIVSTDPEEIVINPDPTVPNLYADALSDAEIQVEWKYNTDFTYELVYSLTDDVSTGESVPIVLPEEDDDDYPVNGAYYPVTVDDLFPLTTYYFWIRATEEASSATSAWSNPVSERTLDVTTPVPPRGLGILPDTDAEKYGYDVSVSEDYFTVEWLLDEADEETDADTESNVTKTYTYIVELSENAKFIDPVYVESSGGTSDVVPSSVEVLEKNILKFNELIGNRYYYVRAKTKLVVEGSEEGQYMEKISASYTSPIRILTLSTGNEYDGNIDPALEILPDEDYELIYDSEKDLLEFRFRSSEKDDDGASDNSVDQRLISDLIKEKSTFYEIDLSSYKNKAIDQCRVTMPYSIVEAFDDYGIEMIVLTENMNLSIPHDSLVGEVYDQVNSFGVAPTVVIDITEMTASDVYDQLPDSGLQSVATPQEIKVNVISNRDSKQVFYADEPIEVTIPVVQWYGIEDEDVTAFVEDSRGNWTEEVSDYNDKSHTVFLETAKLGGIGAFVYQRGETIDGINQDPDHWSEVYRREVYSEFTVLGNDTYNPEASVSETAVAQAVYGTVAGSKIIDLEQPLTSAQVQTLLRAGIIQDESVADGTLDKQTAVSMMVRAYEIIDGDTLPADEATVEEVQALSGVDSAHVQNLAKAADAGLVSSVSGLQPKDALNYGEFFTLWSRLID